jgi:hypothetical protein
MTKDPHQPTSERDEQFSRQVADSLERSLDDLDEHTLAQLARARRTAINHRSYKREWIGGLAVAASVAALVVVPMVGQFDQTSHQPDDLDLNMTYLQEDPQMLLDMEMLLAIGESDIES